MRWQCSLKKTADKLSQTVIASHAGDTSILALQQHQSTSGTTQILCDLQAWHPVKQ